MHWHQLCLVELGFRTHSRSVLSMKMKDLFRDCVQTPYLLDFIGSARIGSVVQSKQIVNHNRSNSILTNSVMECICQKYR